VLLAMLVAFAPACQTDDGVSLRRAPSGSRPSTGARIIGFVGTLSGPDSWRGEDAFEGADLAVHALNRRRGPGTVPFELRPLDDEGDAGAATQLVEQLADLSATVGVVYAGPPEGLPPAEGALAAAGVPAILCFGELLGGAPPHQFATSLPFAAQARALVGYLGRDRGYRRIGVLVEGSPSGAAALDELRRAVTAPLDLVAARGEPGRSTQEALRRLRRRRVEAVVVTGDPGALSDVVRVLRRWGSTYRTTAAARTISRPGSALPRPPGRTWRPQLAGFDLAISPGAGPVVAGAVAPDLYTRGSHYLPLGPLRRFRNAFEAWWGSPPTGWQARAYDAARAIGWAARGAEPGSDLAERLEDLSGRRFAGLPVSFGPRDHHAYGTRSLGLWVMPGPGAGTPEQTRAEAFRAFPWVPLARSFTSGRAITGILPADRPHLFRRRPADAPPFARMRFGVTTPRSDPVH
jgi:ABC-type branched-subunit amino acid transport system substrate-binding protein